jgi:hypothetical protein
LKFKAYNDPQWLREEYVTKRKTAKEISELCGVTEMTIYNALKKFDLLKFRGKGRNLGRRRFGPTKTDKIF